MSKNFVRHLCVLVLRHQMQVSNYFVNSFYSESTLLSPLANHGYVPPVSSYVVRPDWIRHSILATNILGDWNNLQKGFQMELKSAEKSEVLTNLLLQPH